MDPNIAYQNAEFIANAAAFPVKWAQASREWRKGEQAAGRARLDLDYGDDPRQKFDLFCPAARPIGLMVFVHGGYWRAFGRDDWSHLAAGATARGWAVAIPSYRLAPSVRIAEITRDIALALAAAARIVAGPIVLCGHSAGGHLCARMICADVGLPAAVWERIIRVVPISPLSDLRPLVALEMNADLKFDAAEAAAESLVLCVPRAGVAVTVWVGAEERPAFLDQAIWLQEAWKGATLHVASGRHHFDVLDELAEPDSPLMGALLGPA
jgi:acetyl esterase/lipase